MHYLRQLTTHFNFLSVQVSPLWMDAAPTLSPILNQSVFQHSQKHPLCTGADAPEMVPSFKYSKNRFAKLIQNIGHVSVAIGS